MLLTPLDWHLNERLCAKHGVANVAALLGFIPTFLSEADPDPAWRQIDQRYVGGWDPALPGKWQMNQDNYLFFPGDPPLEPVAFAFLRDEAIFVYPYAWVAIAQKDGSFSVARLD